MIFFFYIFFSISSCLIDTNFLCTVINIIYYGGSERFSTPSFWIYLSGIWRMCLRDRQRIENLSKYLCTSSSSVFVILLFSIPVPLIFCIVFLWSGKWSLKREKMMVKSVDVLGTSCYTSAYWLWLTFPRFYSPRIKLDIPQGRSRPTVGVVLYSK